jgi:hypothetical protein
MISELKDKIIQKDVYESYLPLIDKLDKTTSVVQNDITKVKHLDETITNFEKYLIKNIVQNKDN